MYLEQINLNQLRLFEAVFRTQSMTKAAQELHLTQSGISQHMKSLEEALGVALFDRIRQKLVPTAAGRFLYEVCREKLQDLESALQEVARHEGNLTGEVRIGVPAEFGINVICPMVADFLRLHPEVHVRVLIELADEMNRLLLKGEVDFAIVDEFDLDGRIDVSPVFNEHLELCFSPSFIHPDRARGPQERKFFESLHYVAYREDLPVLQKWFSHHYGFRKMPLNVRAVVGDVLGVSRFITAGVAVGVLPRHYAEKAKQQGESLLSFENTKEPLINKLSMAFVKERTHSPLVLTFKKWLTEQLSSHRARFGGPQERLSLR